MKLFNMHNTLKIQKLFVSLANYKGVGNEEKAFVLNMKNRKIIYPTN